MKTSWIAERTIRPEDAKRLCRVVLDIMALRRWGAVPIQAVGAVRVGYFGSKATSGLGQPLIAMMPPHDTCIETH